MYKTKTMNTILWGLCATYFLFLIINIINTNNKVVKISSVVSTIKDIRGGRSKFYYYEYHLKEDSFYLKKSYLIIPSLMSWIERNRLKEGDSISCFIDKKDFQFEAYNAYVPIGLAVNKGCVKKLKYWLSLYSYVAKNISHFIFLIIIIFICAYTGKSQYTIQLEAMGVYFFILYFIL